MTGSCHQIQREAERQLLVDCVFFRGDETFSGRGASRRDIGLSRSDIPCLLVAGFNWVILYWRKASAKRLLIFSEGAFNLGFSCDEGKVARCHKLIQQPSYGNLYGLIDSSRLKASLRLLRTGHILGSAYMEKCLLYPDQASGRRIVFSGGWTRRMCRSSLCPSLLIAPTLW